MYPKGEIVYPYFLHCCSKTADHFWKYIFEDLSYGKTPYGSYINKNFLCCNFKGKNFSYKLDFNKTYDKTFNDIYDLFVKKLGILSPTDKFNKRKKFDKQSDDMSISECNNWTEIKKKELKNILLEIYFLKLAKKYKWTKPVLKKKLALIQLALNLKVINNSDIKIENGVIQNIINIEIYNKPIKEWEYNWRFKTECQSKSFINI